MPKSQGMGGEGKQKISGRSAGLGYRLDMRSQQHKEVTVIPG